MKRQICRCPGAQKILKADRPLEKQIAKNTAQLQRVRRSLQVMGLWNRKLVRVAETLLRSVVRDAKRKDGFKACKQLTELCARYDSLTPREQQVMAFVVNGSPNKQIAAQLGTAEITIKVHRASVMKKMKADSIADLVRMAERMRTGSRLPRTSYRHALRRST